MSKCVVLGGNGFLGSHLIDALVESGHEVRAFDRFKEGKHTFLPSEHIEIMSGDFLNRSDLKKALEGMEYVFHFVSTTTPTTSENNPLIDVETNIRMSVELFEECAAVGIKKVIFASTGGAIYGSNSSEHVSEDVLPEPISPYAIGKLSIEHYLHYFATKRGLKSTVYRISNPYGERQSLAAKQGVIPIFLQHIAKNEPITVLGDGSMVRDYIYVKDIAQMIVGSFVSASQGLYNLGSGHGLSVNELVSAIRDVVSRDIQVEYAEKPSTFVDKIVLDTTRFEEEFGIATQTELAKGIETTWQYVSRTIAALGA